MTKTLKQLIDPLLAGSIEVIPHDSDVEVAGITDDNRRVQPGFVFVAYPGVAVDGHKFIPDAVRRGAVAIVCERGQAELSVPQVVVQ